MNTSLGNSYCVATIDFSDVETLAALFIPLQRSFAEVMCGLYELQVIGKQPFASAFQECYGLSLESAKSFERVLRDNLRWHMVQQPDLMDRVAYHVILKKSSRKFFASKECREFLQLIKDIGFDDAVMTHF